MDYSEAAAFFGVWIAEGQRVMESMEATGSTSADPPAAAANSQGSAGQQAQRPSEGEQRLAAVGATAPSSADAPADQPQPAGEQAGQRPSEGERRLAAVGAAIARHMHLLMVWNASTFMAVCSRNHHSGEECVGSQDAPFQVGRAPRASMQRAVGGRDACRLCCTGGCPQQLQPAVLARPC